MDMAAFGTAKNASKWHGVFPASLCRRLGGFSFGAMAADAEVGGRPQPQAERRREQAVTARRGFLGLLPQFRGAAGGQVAAAAETASKLRRNGVVYFMSYLHRIFYVLSCFVVM